MFSKNNEDIFNNISNVSLQHTLASGYIYASISQHILMCIKFRNILLQGLPNLASSSIGFCARIRHTVLPLFDTLYKI